jgi:hypothetical protein
MRPSNLTIRIPNLPSLPPPQAENPPQTMATERQHEMSYSSHEKLQDSPLTLNTLSQAALANPDANQPDAGRPRRLATRRRPRLPSQSGNRDSLTSIESNGSDYDTSDDEAPPLSAVPESPIAKLRYPRVPRDSNSRSSINLRVQTGGTNPSLEKGKRVNTTPSTSTPPAGSPARHTRWSPSTPMMKRRGSPRSTPSPNISSASSGYRGVEDKLWRTEVSPTTVAQVHYPEPEHYYSYSPYSHAQYFGPAPIPPRTPDSAPSQGLQVPRNVAWKRESPTRHQHLEAPPMSPFGATPILTPTKLGKDLYISVRR